VQERELMAGDRFSGVALGSIAAGALFVYAGVKGYSVPQTIKALISGQAPGGQTQATPVSGNVAGSTASTAAATGTAPVVTGDYSTAQLQQLWQAAGGSASSAPNAACHAMQESTGRPGVTSPNPDGGTNVGLWQLDTKGVGAGHTVAELQDPMTNAQITVSATRDGADWAEWSTPGC
jgi:hypothetical protein